MEKINSNETKDENCENKKMSILDKINNKSQRTKNIRKEIISLIKLVVLVFIIVFVINNFVIINAEVPTGSMISTINPGDRLVSLRLSYIFQDPKRGDIITFKYPDDEKQIFTKRVIGLPGEKVEIKDGRVFINDSDVYLNEPYVNGNFTGDYGPYNVPENSYFVLGDNRGNSLDSRFWKNTYVEKNEVLGKMIFKYYPKFELLWNDIVY